MKKKRIILSYDYELFFGDRSGTVLKSIIEPTNKLMDVMEQNGFRGNFFVDYLMFRELEKLSDERAAADLNLLKEQIRDMVRRGHRVELHLHPHWIDAKYNGDGTWDFSNFTHYSLSSLGEDIIVDLFVSGTNYLTALAREVDSNYKIVAFRAGGWAVQPFEKLKRGFIEAGIKIDSSTSFGLYSIKKGQEYNFCNMPDKDMFCFENDVCIEDTEGNFIEIPITSFHIPFFFYLCELVKKRSSNFDHYSDGTHVRKDAIRPQKKKVLKRIEEKFDNSIRGLINFSFISPTPIIHYIKRVDDNSLICFIDHPKDVCPSTIDGINRIGGYCESINYIDLVK